MTADGSEPDVGLPPISEIAAQARAETDARVAAMIAAEPDAPSADVGDSTKPKGEDGWRTAVFLDELKKVPVFALGMGALAFFIVVAWAFQATSPEGVTIANRCSTPVELRFIPESAGSTSGDHQTSVIAAGDTLELEPLLVLDFPHFTQAIGYDENQRNTTIEIVLSPEGSNCPVPQPVEQAPGSAPGQPADQMPDEFVEPET